MLPLANNLYEYILLANLINAIRYKIFSILLNPEIQ